MADNLSWLNHLISLAHIVEGKCLVEPAVVPDNKDDTYFLTQEYSGCHEDDLVGVIECYFNLPEISHPYCNPLNNAHIWELQQQDTKLLSVCTKYPDNYVKLKLDDDVNDIICYEKDPTQDNSKIVLPDEMVLDTVKWFHQVMGHPGQGYMTR